MTCQINKPSTSMTNVACEVKLRSVVGSFMHPCPGHGVAIGHAVVNHARAAQALSAGITCRHCIVIFEPFIGLGFELNGKGNEFKAIT